MLGQPNSKDIVFGSQSLGFSSKVFDPFIILGFLQVFVLHDELNWKKNSYSAEAMVSSDTLFVYFLLTFPGKVQEKMAQNKVIYIYCEISFCFFPMMVIFIFILFLLWCKYVYYSLSQILGSGLWSPTRREMAMRPPSLRNRHNLRPRLLRTLLKPSLSSKSRWVLL